MSPKLRFSSVDGSVGFIFPLFPALKATEQDEGAHVPSFLEGVALLV